MIGWHPKHAPLPELFKITATRAGDAQPVAGELVGYETSNLSVDVRDELQNYGFVVPPDGIIWLIVSFAGSAPVDNVEIKYEGNGVSLNDTLVITPPIPRTFATTRP